MDRVWEPVQKSVLPQISVQSLVLGVRGFPIYKVVEMKVPTSQRCG